MALHNLESAFSLGDLDDVFLDLNNRPPEVTVTELRRNLLDKVRDSLVALPAERKTSVEDFKKQLQEEFSAQIQQCMIGGEDPTILHWLAKKIKLDSVPATNATFKAAGFLAEIATSMEPAMLSTQDSSSSTPIHLFADYADTALKGVGDIILRMCRAAESSNHASNAISSQNKERENGLHVAVKKQLDITEDLIQISTSEAVLAVRDGSNTPLHDAVDPALLHYTEQRCNKKNASSELCLSCATKTQIMTTKFRQRLGVVAALITKQPKALKEKNDLDQSPYLFHQQLRKQPVRQAVAPNKPNSATKDKDGTVSSVGGNNASPCQEIPSDALDRMIEKFLVESAFALGGFEDACQCFFGKSNHSHGLHTIFRLDRPLTGFDSEKMYSFFNCGTTLAQVDVSIDPMDSADRKIKGTPVGMDPLLLEDARTALSNVFVMLKQKKVKRILKLKVRDNQQVPCSDEFIEACLKHFDIRYFDWNKPNLCADVIIASAPRAAEVRLYATGSTAVLRSWAGSNGLANLQQLRVLHLFTEMGLEKHPWHMLDVAGFEEDLRNNVEITRKLKIITEKEKRSMHAIIEFQKGVKVAESVLSLFHQREAENKNLKSKGENLGLFESYKISYYRELEQQKKNLELEEAGLPKFRAGKTALLGKREEHLEQMVARIRERMRQHQAHNTLKVGPSAPVPSSKIDLSDLTAWGFPVMSNPAFEVDFVALDFAIQRTTPEPSTKAGGKLVMKKVMKGDETSSKQHRWVESLRNFVSSYVQGDSKNTRVKVALIDDGVDADLDDLRAMVKDGWPTEEPTSIGTPFYQSTDGHGTAMARLIATACPHVDLYVAKLKSLNKVISRNETWRLAADENSDAWTSTADEAASAIEWARKKGVNIISMSWTLIETQQNSKEISRLQAQIMDAAREKIIMYCAAADQGLYGGLKKLHPAGSDATIRVVGSATETGHSSGFVHQDQVNYLFPGEEFEEIGNRKGSSAATALAAGFTALILWCFEASERNGKSKDRNRMHNPEHMHYLFEGLQNLINQSASKTSSRQSKWVDASLLLDRRGGSEGIDAVVETVDSITWPKR